MQLGKLKKWGVVGLLMAVVLTGCGGAEERKAKYLERARAYFEEQNFDKAKIEFKNVLQIDPKTAAPYYYLGQIEESEQQWRQAFGYYSKAVELDPELLEARVQLGRFYMLAGQPENAAEQADEILSREPAHADGLTLRASVLARSDKQDEALTILQGVLEKAPGNEGAAALMAALLNQQDRGDEAVVVLEQAISANAGSVALKTSLIQLHLKQNRNDRAEDLLIELSDSNPDVLQYRATLASFYVKTGQPEKAEAALRQAIAADPEDAQRYLLLTDMLNTRFGPERAIDDLQNSIREQPDMTELRIALARLFIQSEQSDMAEAEYRKLIDDYGIEPAALSARVDMAALCMQQQRFDEARVFVNEVLAENPKDSKALMLQGRLALNDKAYTDAITAFRSVLKGQPDSSEALTLLAAAHEANGENELALENLSRAVELQPADVQAHLRLAGFVGQRGELDAALEHINAALEADPDSVPALRARAEILAKQGNVGDLESTLTRLEKASSDTGLGAFGKGRLYKAQKKYDQAVAAFEEALRREPESILGLTELVNTEIAMGDPDAAVSRLSKILEDNPDHRAAHDLLGIAYMARQDFAAAEREFLQQLKINDRSSVVYTQIATARLRQGNHTGAVEIMRDGLVALPNDERLLQGMAGYYVRKGELENAVNTYMQGMRAHPEDASFPLGVAGVRERQGKFEEAISIYEQMLETHPDNVVVLNNLAALLSDHRTDEQSLQRARELALRLRDSQQPAFLDTLGWIHYRLGEYDEAASVLSSVVEQAPEVPVFRYHLGMTYYKQGDNRAAKEILSKAIAETYTYAGVDEARKVYAEVSKE